MMYIDDRQEGMRQAGSICSDFGSYRWDQLYGAGLKMGPFASGTCRPVNTW